MPPLFYIITMKKVLLAALLGWNLAVATPIESTCQRYAAEQKMVGQARADYLRTCRAGQGMPAAIAMCEKYLANKNIDGFQKQHAMQLCFLDYLHPGNGPYTPPGQVRSQAGQYK